MTIRRIDIGERMSQTVVHGNTVYTAGQVARDAPGASVTDQTTNILAAIDRLLSEAGTDKSKLLSATIWISDMSTFSEMNAVWDTWVEINLSKATEMGIKEGDILKITAVDSKHSIEGVAYPNPATPPNVVGIPMGQGRTEGTRYSKNRGANILSILSTMKDAKTGALAWGSTKILNSATGVIFPKHNPAPPIKTISFILLAIVGSFFNARAILVKGPVGHK